MSILKKHIQPRERLILDNGQIVIFNPNANEKTLIKNKLEKSAKLQTNSEGQLSVQTNFDELSMVRFLIENITNLSEDIKSLSNEELFQILENGDKTIQDMLKEFKSIIKEISQEYIEGLRDQLDTLINLFDQQEDVDKLEQLASKLNMSVEDLLNLANKQNKVNELQKKQLPTPQDHKQPKKRGRKKKVVENIEEVNINA